MSDIFKPVTQWIATNVGWSVLAGLFVLSLFFEFSKIKLSPITSFFRWIGDRLLGSLRSDIAALKENTDSKFAEMKAETDQHLTELKNSVNESLAEIKAKTNFMESESQRQRKDIEERLDRLAAARIKAHVLEFSRECRNQERHTHEDFKNLIEENEEYEGLVAKYKWRNDVYKEDYEYIMEIYRKCIRENDFLK